MIIYFNFDIKCGLFQAFLFLIHLYVNFDCFSLVLLSDKRGGGFVHSLEVLWDLLAEPMRVVDNCGDQTVRSFLDIYRN